MSHLLADYTMSQNVLAI